MHTLQCSPHIQRAGELQSGNAAHHLCLQSPTFHGRKMSSWHLPGSPAQDLGKVEELQAAPLTLEIFALGGSIQKLPGTTSTGAWRSTTYPGSFASLPRKCPRTVPSSQLCAQTLGALQSDVDLMLSACSAVVGSMF